MTAPLSSSRDKYSRGVSLRASGGEGGRQPPFRRNRKRAP